MADSAENLAARGFDGGGAIALHVFAEGVIGGHEEPGLRPLPNESLAEPGSERVSVIGPVNEISRTFRAGHDGRTRSRADRRLVLLFGDADHRERDGGI